MSRWHPLPAALYDFVDRTPSTVLLPAARPNATQGSESDRLLGRGLSRVFANPLCIRTAKQLTEIPRLFAEIQSAVDAGLYAAGYFTYECGAFFEPTAASVLHTPDTPTAQPLAWFGIYTAPHIFDHQTGAFLGDDSGHPILAPHRAPADNCQPEDGSKGVHEFDAGAIEYTFSFTEAEYTRQIAAIQEKIRSGDIYQLNFTFPLHIQASGSSATLYRHLQAQQPTPYSAFLHTQTGHRVLSFSPELFFRIENEGNKRRISTRPMKGTAPRGRTTLEDRSQASWLQSDAKNLAENVMIVDLLRNDLGRLCKFGSVHAENLFAVERYPTLWQMTSSVSGELRPEVDFQQVFRALFPCGSITGAPKIRAMQLIAEFETRPRGIYTGAIGFFSNAQTVFNVAIRTVTLGGDRETMGVGSGIVIDSDPADEFRECLLKARFLTRLSKVSTEPSAEDFALVETMLWAGDYPLIELHLDRLEDSANYFDYPFHRSEVKATLQAYPANSLLSPPRKVRLLLHADGSLEITSGPIPAQTSRPRKIRISKQRTDPADRMYFHKTTHRPLYAQALKDAQSAGYDDVLFLNLRDELTEAAIHNVFIQDAGRLLTPPVGCAVLPGVQRRHILETNPNAREQILTLDDLRRAEAVYLSNAVRGLRPAVIDWQ